MMHDEYFQKYCELLSRQNYDPQSMDYANLDRHIAFLKQLAAVENSSVGVVDVYKQRYVFMQSKYLSVLGKELDDVLRQGQRGLFELMHSEDIGFVIETHYRVAKFLLGVPVADRKKYKTVYDFRMKDRNGVFLRFIQQLIPLELDANGNVWLMLLLNDIVPGKGEFKRQQRRLVNIETGRLHLFTGEDAAKAKSVLSAREIEVLTLLGKGMASKHIADELFLSVNTVNNHRRRILEKTSTESSAGAVGYAISMGLI